MFVVLWFFHIWQWEYKISVVHSSIFSSINICTWGIWNLGFWYSVVLYFMWKLTLNVGIQTLKKVVIKWGCGVLSPFQANTSNTHTKNLQYKLNFANEDFKNTLITIQMVIKKWGFPQLQVYLQLPRIHVSRFCMFACCFTSEHTHKLCVAVLFSTAMVYLLLVLSVE